MWIHDVLWRSSLWSMGCSYWFCALAPGLPTFQVAADEWREPNMGRCEGEVGWSPFSSPWATRVPLGSRHECSTSPRGWIFAVAPAGGDLRANICGDGLPRISRGGLFMGSGRKALCRVARRCGRGIGLSAMPLRTEVGHHLMQRCFWDGRRSAGISLSQCSWSFGRCLFSLLGSTIMAGGEPCFWAHAREKCSMVPGTLCQGGEPWSGFAVSPTCGHPCSLDGFGRSKSGRGHRSQDLCGGRGKPSKQCAFDRRVTVVPQGEGFGECGGARHSAPWSQHGADLCGGPAYFGWTSCSAGECSKQTTEGSHWLPYWSRRSSHCSIERGSAFAECPRWGPSSKLLAGRIVGSTSEVFGGEKGRLYGSVGYDPGKFRGAGQQSARGPALAFHWGSQAGDDRICRRILGWLRSTVDTNSACVIWTESSLKQLPGRRRQLIGWNVQLIALWSG